MQKTVLYYFPPICQGIFIVGGKGAYMGGAGNPPPPFQIKSGNPILLYTIYREA